MSAEKPPRPAPAPRVATRVLDCAASPGALWPFVTDTERLNRAMGLKPVSAEPIFGAGAARYVVRTTSGGLPIEFEERPFEWVQPERWGVRRVFRKGVIREFLMENSLEALESGGSRATLRLALAPRHTVSAFLVGFAAREGVRRLARVVRAIDAELAKGGRPRVEAKAARLHEDPLERGLDVLRGRLGEALRPLVHALATELRDGTDVELSRMRPYELAERWGASRRDTLVVCLEAVVAGLLELSWELVCPSCRVGAESAPHLAELENEGHCQLCDLRFGLDFDQTVEATLRPTPAVRELDSATYCLGGPARTPHVIAQLVLPASGFVNLRAPSDPGRYRLFVRGGLASSVDVALGGDPASDFEVGAAVSPAAVHVRPGAELRVHQEGGEERHLKLERLEWASHAATGFSLSLLPEFRRLFSSEVLRPGLALRVRRAAILFTDLTGSTAFYESLGDAAAFAFVQDHFELLRRVVDGHDGALVKTIGDSVMAAFATEDHFARALVATQVAFAELRASRPIAAQVGLRTGGHAGAVFAVTANGVIDYFGQTVNMAARLQGKAEDGEIVVARDLYERATPGAFAGAEVVEHFDTPVKGVRGKVAAVRLVVSGATPPAEHEEKT